MSDDGKRVVDLLRQLAKQFFDLDIDRASASRGHQFWALSINSETKTSRDILGNVDEVAMEIINRNFQDSHAGFRASAHKYVGFETKADIFLINERHITKLDAEIGPMLVHEACHFVEQVGQGKKGSFSDADKHNANEILGNFHLDKAALP